MVAATDLKVQLCSGCLVVEATAEIDVQLGAGLRRPGGGSCCRGGGVIWRYINKTELN